MNGLVRTLAVLLLLPGVVGCGGGSTAEESATPTAAQSVSASAALSCMQQAGLEAQETQAPVGSAIGVTDSIRVTVGAKNAIVIDFFSDAGQAADYADNEQAFLSAAGAGGGAEVVADTVVVGVARSGAEAALETVKGCLGG